MENIVKHGKNTIIAHLEHLKHHQEYKLLEEAINFLEENNIDFPEEFKNLKEANTNNVRPNQAEDEKGCEMNVLEDIEHIKEKTHNKFTGCPGSRTIDLTNKTNKKEHKKSNESTRELSETIVVKSQLRNWPIQIMLAPLKASYYKDADLLIAADCSNVAYPNLHQKYLKGRTLLMGCPKLDNGQFYIEKLTEIFKQNQFKSIYILIMEVPCCSGILYIIKEALERSKEENIIPLSYEIVKINGEIKEIDPNAYFF